MFNEAEFFTVADFTAVVPKTAPCEGLPVNPRIYSLMTHFNFTEFSNILILCRKQKQVSYFN